VLLAALFVILIVMFVIVPLVGLTLWLLVSAVITGLIIGGLGRLVVPGRQSIGCLPTAVAGLVGSIGGSLLGHALALHRLATVLIEIGVAAGVVIAITRRNTREIQR